MTLQLYNFYNNKYNKYFIFINDVSSLVINALSSYLLSSYVCGRQNYKMASRDLFLVYVPCIMPSA